MGISDTKNGCYIYHLTRLSNLDSILKNGLMSRNELVKSHTNFSDIADTGILAKRKNYDLDQYVPFHFHPYSAFDCAVKKSNAADDFIYICIKRTVAQRKAFKILPIHPASNSMGDFKLFDYEEGFEQIDWDTMQTEGVENDYTKHVKMAECLGPSTISASNIHAIAVQNKEIENKVRLLLWGNDLNHIYVDIQPWFEV